MRLLKYIFFCGTTRCCENRVNTLNDTQELPDYIALIYKNNQMRHITSLSLSLDVISLYLQTLEYENLEQLYRNCHILIMDDINLTQEMFIRLVTLCDIIYNVHLLNIIV